MTSRIKATKSMEFDANRKGNSSETSGLPMSVQRFAEVFQRRAEAFKELEKKMSNSKLSKNPRELETLGREYSRERGQISNIENFNTLYRQFLQANELFQSAECEKENEMKELAREEVDRLRKILIDQSEKMRDSLLQSDPNEGCDLWLEIRAATGGAESALFVGDLLRMYKYFAQRKNIQFELITMQSTELGGVKEVVVECKGKLAYTLFQCEAGTHRVQRIPETEAGGRIHTSTATVAILPVKEIEEMEINLEDLVIDVYRASGAGGQHVNTTESAIRITHIPSGIVVTCQDERSQHKNKAKAMKVLRARIIQHEEGKRHEATVSLKRSQVKSGERSERIRTYNFPQGRLSDHRIGFHSHNLPEIMDGGLDELCAALLHAKKEAAIAKQ